MAFGYLTLLTALIISLSSAVYSILGLTAIFSAAFWPIVIMGGSLEVGKIVTTLWLHKYWNRAGLQYKVYLCSAVAILMFLTSMGVFGFLSKAHSDQSLVSGDVQSKIAIYDEKIKTARENIDANRNQLRQMDAAVDQVMSRSTTESGADKSNAIRRSQAKDRAALNKDIEANQRLIATLNDEAAPIRAEVRKVEAEVGPIKYIAAMVYGDNPDANLLEHAVRWVIILIVAVFDPLALTLLLAATKTFEWERGIDLFNMNNKTQEQAVEEEVHEILEETALSPQPAPIPDNAFVVDKKVDLNLTAEELGAWDDFFAGLKTNQEVDRTYFPEFNAETANAAPISTNLEPDPLPAPVPEIVPDPVPEPAPVVEEQPLERPGDYTIIDEHSADSNLIKLAQISHPDKDDPHAWKQESFIHGLPLSDGEKKKLLAHIALTADNTPPLLGTVTGFGIAFPQNPSKGDLFLRVDQLPSVLFKFNGDTWMAVDKNLNDSYVYSEAYIDHLIDKISSGEYDLDLLSDSEREQIALRLKDQA